jgi:metal-responsive CopG/Arc/MetJ family transcriptional regulator
VALCGSAGSVAQLDRKPHRGYINGMKTAVSIPDKVFQGAERLAKRSKKSRSQLFSDALKEYVARHAPEDVTEAMNQVCGKLGDAKDPFVSEAARRTLERNEW